jgi:putative sterol carrier protein
MSGPSIAPELAAELIGQASDDQLADGMRENRDLILGQVFASMPARIDPVKTAEVEAVAEWRIGDRQDGGVDRWQVRIERGACQVEREGTAEPTVVFELGAIDFLKLVTGNEKGPKLFLFGRLRISGDLMLAARMHNLFKIPARARAAD